MTAPMPETLSPREKVELKPCPFCGASATLERDTDHHGGWFNLGCGAPWKEEDACPGYHAFYTCDPSEEAGAIAAWNRRAALASSGDHAELARKPDDLLALLRADRLPECSFDNGMTWVTDDVIVSETFTRAADALEALIAENAALRGERDAANASARSWSRTVGEVVVIGENWKERCVEAGRKLAEAHELLSEWLAQSCDDDQIPKLQGRTRTFLSSKEAERG